MNKDLNLSENRRHPLFAGLNLFIHLSYGLDERSYKLDFLKGYEPARFAVRLFT